MTLVRLPTHRRKSRLPERGPKVLPPVRWPYAEEVGYQAALMGVSRRATRGTEELIIPALPALVTYVGKRVPRTDDISDRLEGLMGKVRGIFSVASKEARRMAQQMLDAVSEQQTIEMVNTTRGVIPVNPQIGNEKWLPSAMELATQENVALIQSIPAQHYAEVEQLVRDGVMQGLRAEDIAAQLRTRYGVTETRALRIARDQVGKFHGSMQRLRQLDAGVASYKWSCSMDERVRPMHRALEGRIIRWNEPPVVSQSGRRCHPGMDVMCRCVACAVITDDEE